MSVQEIIAQLKDLDSIERQEVQAALHALAAKPRMDEEQAKQRLEDVWKLLDEGWCEMGGRNLSEGIDEAVYGERREA